MNHAALAQGLLDAVRGLPFDRVADGWFGHRPLRQFPSLDIAVVGFPRGGDAVWANVLFSREHPQGVVAGIDGRASSVQDVRFVADAIDGAGRSIAWLPDSDWDRIGWRPLQGDSGPRMVAPYPASLFKLLVAVGVARLVDRGACDWNTPQGFDGRERALADWAEDMIAFSCNASTSALLAALHRFGAILGDPGQAQRNDVHDALEAQGLRSLRLASTRPDGAWGNAAGAGVGQLQMTAWDSVRLLWLLDPTAPAAPWPEANPQSLLSDQSRARIVGWLGEQALHDILSSTALAGLPGFARGLPALQPARWIQPDGSVQAGKYRFAPDVRPESLRAEVDFAHKTGTTDNYASDAGIVRGRGANRRHYLVAVLSSLGRRYAPSGCATTWCLPLLGSRIDAMMAGWLE